MMPLLGFFALVVMGLVFVMLALAGAGVSQRQAGHVRWSHIFIYGGCGTFLLCYAWMNAPLAVRTWMAP